VRGVLLLVVGLAAGLVAGWALFGADGAAGRARHRGTGTEASEHARDDTTGPADTGSVHGAAGAAGEARRSVRSLDPEERIVRSLMREAYDRQSKDGKAPEADIFEAGVGEVLRRSGRYREADTSSTGAALVYREKLRAEAGEIAGSPLVLQICVAGGVTARLTDRGNSDRFEVGAPPAQGANLLHVSGGTVPPGSMFLIERVVLRAYAGSRGRLNVALPEMDRFDWDSGEAGKNTTALELKGLVRLMHGRERDVYVSAFGVAASVEMHGRLVPAAEGESMRARPLVMGDGWLTGEPVLMQVRPTTGAGTTGRSTSTASSTASTRSSRRASGRTHPTSSEQVRSRTTGAAVSSLPGRRSA
jgi:hypothetical protein